MLGRMEVAHCSGTGHRFAKHSHDECVIGVNLVGVEEVWLDRRTFSAQPGDITLYNPGQIQGGGVKEGEPWRFAGLYLCADRLAADFGLAHLEFERACWRQPRPVRRAPAGPGSDRPARPVATGRRRPR